jgi:hypothetical protein
MRLAELQQALREADPAAVLVAPRVLERIIQGQRQLSSLFEQVPHRKCYVVDRATLYRYVEQDELDLEPDRLLPPTVLLLARPSPNTLTMEDRETILLTYWRRLFHAGVHRVLQQEVSDGRLTPTVIRSRIDTIGPGTFAEIRMVLEQEKYMPPRDADETESYIEFAAVYLELRYFAANLLPIYFPGLEDRSKIDALLDADIDAASLFTHTRLPGAPDPVFRTDTSSDESHDYYRKLMDSADRAEHAGNTVRAAILRTRAARVAPASLEDSTRERAHDDLRRLTRRLQAALELRDPEADEWLQDLPSLLDKADQGSWPVEAALLYDLQKVGVDNERDIYALDVVTWLASGGHRPIKRPLPSQRLVRITKHLRSAAQRLTQARLADDERQHLARLLQSALHHCEERLRSRFRPVLNDALLTVGLQPSNAPERTAFARMVEEMLDRIVELGFLTFSDLRDTISRNQLKMPDLQDPHEFVRGDPLLRLDRRLATALDGVYRPGELYLRWLERLTAPAFGTAVGRWLMLWLLVPFGGAAMMVLGAEVIYDFFSPPGQVVRAVTEMPAQAAARAPDEAAQEKPLPPVPPPTPAAVIAASEPPWPWQSDRDVLLIKLAVTLSLGLFLLALLHVEWFRQRCRQAMMLSYRALRGLLIDLPIYLARLEVVQKALNSWAFSLFWSFMFKPAVVCALLFELLPRGTLPNWPSWFITFLLVNLVINSRFGKGVGEAIVQAVANVYELLRAGLLPGLLRLLLWAFKRTIDTMEYVLHTVDEWLRFRQGESQLSLVVRAVLGLIWYPLAWLVRFYLVVLVEPGFHPLKAPISILAAKFTYPILFPLTRRWVSENFDPVLPELIAYGIAILTVWLFPDAFGFLFWETKENWRLYRANREKQLKPVGVGPHGETVRQLLQPGFHSGTVPKLYARLREAEREAIRTGSWRAARTLRRSLTEVEQTIGRLVERELIKLLQESTRWKGESLRVVDVALTPKRIGIELAKSGAAAPVRLEWEHQAGWLVAGICQPGWLEELGEEPRQAVTTALAGLYKLAGIDLVREQVREKLPPPATDFTLTERNLVVEIGPRRDPVVTYDLTRPKGLLKPRTLNGSPTADWPPLDPRKVLFARVPLSWEQWVESWRGASDGQTPSALLSASVILLPSETADGVETCRLGAPSTAVAPLQGDAGQGEPNGHAVDRAESHKEESLASDSAPESLQNSSSASTPSGTRNSP